MATKSELRTAYKNKRQKLSLEQLDEFSINIANQLLTLDIWKYNYYHVFLSIEEQREVNTDYILSILSGKDKNIIISKNDFKTREMTHFLLTDSTKIKKNQYNIPEPIDGIEIPESKIEVVFIPLLAFDKKGHRVGYGKGFYDKFLSKCKVETLKIGLSFFEAEHQIDDIFESDIPLNYCITPKKVYSF